TTPGGELKKIIPGITRDESADHDEILQHLTSLNAGGTYIFYGHSAMDPKTFKVTAIQPSSGHSVSGKDMEDALGKDKNPPGLVVLGGCGPASLLPNIINAGVPVAVGTSDSGANIGINVAVTAFMQAVTAGKTLAEAKEAGDTELQKIVQIQF